MGEIGSERDLERDEATAARHGGAGGEMLGGRGGPGGSRNR